MTNIVVDCESSGPCPMYGDLIQFGAVAETGESFRSDTFPPLFEHFDEGAYKVLNITQEQHLAFDGDLRAEFESFAKWLSELESDHRHIFWSDNPAYDWQWINWGFNHIGMRNPFGHTARRIGDVYAGANGNLYNQRGWKKWRTTKHTHDPLDDARGAMEGFMAMRKRFKL